jgi:hypothetical protein
MSGQVACCSSSLERRHLALAVRHEVLSQCTRFMIFLGVLTKGDFVFSEMEKKRNIAGISKHDFASFFRMVFFVVIVQAGDVQRDV